MSIRSMTGFGRGEATSAGVTATVELSSVNRKQLDVHLHLPRNLMVFESRVQDALARHMTRGRVTGEISMSWSKAARAKSVQIDEALVEAYVKAIRKTCAKFKLNDDIGARELLSLPDAVQFDRQEEDTEEMWRIISKALQLAVTGLVKMRIAEGRELQKDIERRFDDLSSCVEKIGSKAPDVSRRYQRMLVKRLAEAGIDCVSTDERVLKEIAIYADKCDITEEVTRLESHLKQARKLLRSKEATGRSLDFLAQEMFREINTIGSKANSTFIVNQVISFKAELERVREQLQNVE
ncbi:MAG: YicC family protein [Verrucomicrobia bacterium]|nr:YicC family protein [Verrucomicrobiota bacterium]